MLNVEVDIWMGKWTLDVLCGCRCLCAVVASNRGFRKMLSLQRSLNT